MGGESSKQYPFSARANNYPARSQDTNTIIITSDPRAHHTIDHYSKIAIGCTSAIFSIIYGDFDTRSIGEIAAALTYIDTVVISYHGQPTKTINNAVDVIINNMNAATSLSLIPICPHSVPMKNLRHLGVLHHTNISNEGFIVDLICSNIDSVEYIIDLKYITESSACLRKLLACKSLKSLMLVFDSPCVNVGVVGPATDVFKSAIDHAALLALINTQLHTLSLKYECVTVDPTIFHNISTVIRRNRHIRVVILENVRLVYRHSHHIINMIVSAVVASKHITKFVSTGVMTTGIVEKLAMCKHLQYVSAGPRFTGRGQLNEHEQNVIAMLQNNTMIRQFDFPCTDACGFAIAQIIDRNYELVPAKLEILMSTMTMIFINIVASPYLLVDIIDLSNDALYRYVPRAYKVDFVIKVMLSIERVVNARHKD